MSKSRDLPAMSLAAVMTGLRESLRNLENLSEEAELTKWSSARWVLHRCQSGTFLLDTHSLIDRKIQKTDEWEAPNLAVLRKIIMDNYRQNYDLLFIDVGSYLGWYAIQMAGLGLFREIHAFEANPVNFSQLSANILLNDLFSAVRVHNRCVTEASGWTDVPYPHRAANRGWAETSTEGRQHHGITFAVENAVLDDVFSHVSDRFVVVKVDVEGAEMGVLKGMSRLMERNSVLLQVEVFSKYVGSITEFLTSKGFREIETVDEDIFFLRMQAA